MSFNTRKEIVAYSLDEFVRVIEQNINQGYKLDFDNNENYPLMLGHGMFICGMIHDDSKSIAVNLSVDTTEAVDTLKQVQLELDFEQQEEIEVTPEVTPEVEQQVKPEAKPRRVLKGK